MKIKDNLVKVLPRVIKANIYIKLKLTQSLSIVLCHHAGENVIKLWCLTLVFICNSNTIYIFNDFSVETK